MEGPQGQDTQSVSEVSGPPKSPTVGVIKSRPPSALKRDSSSRGASRAKSSDGRPFHVSFTQVPQFSEVRETPAPPSPPRTPPKPSTKESNRLAKKFFGSFDFGVDDFVRAQDARMGVIPAYLTRLPSSFSEHGSYGPSRATSAASNFSRPSSVASSQDKSVIGDGEGFAPVPSATSGGSRGSARASSAREKRGQKDTAYMKARQEQAERNAREEAKRVEQQARLLKKKQELNNYNAQLLQAWCRSALWRGRSFTHERKLFIFHHRMYAAYIVNRCYSVAVRRRYEAKPYLSPEFQHFFPSLQSSTLPANWECKKASEFVIKRNFKDAHECLKRALADLQERGFLASASEDDLPTAYFAKADLQRAANKSENPFCAVPGCSRRPIKLCEWDGVSKICDQHQFTATWDKDTKSLLFEERHVMNVAAPNRRDFFWVNFLCGIHTRLGAQSFIKDMVLPKDGHHGAEKYDNNPLHFIQTMLIDAWTITVPDEYSNLPEAVAACKDDMLIKIRPGFFSWREPIELRKRIRVLGEEGTVLHGSWVMDEGSGGGTFENLVAVSNGGCIFHMRGGDWKLLRCTLRGFGDGCCVISTSGTAQLSMSECIVSGVDTDHGKLMPYGCITCSGRSTLQAERCCLVDTTGFAVQATNSAAVKMSELLLSGHYRAAIRMEADADVQAKDCRIVNNTAVVMAAGQNIPVQMRNYDPRREELYSEESDCLQLMNNTISGPIWATRNRPVHILGRCQSKLSIDRGDINQDNNFLPDTRHQPPSPPKTCTGNEQFALTIPDNSALKVTSGFDLVEGYVRQRRLVEEEVQPLRARAASRASSRRARSSGTPSKVSLAVADPCEFDAPNRPPWPAQQGPSSTSAPDVAFLDE